MLQDWNTCFYSTMPPTSIPLFSHLVYAALMTALMPTMAPLRREWGSLHDFERPELVILSPLPVPSITISSLFSSTNVSKICFMAYSVAIAAFFGILEFFFWVLPVLLSKNLMTLLCFQFLPIGKTTGPHQTWNGFLIDRYSVIAYRFIYW